MRRPERRGRVCTFAVTEADGRWQVAREAAPVGDFHSRWDAVRAACFKAREEEKHGGRARMVAGPADLLVPHYDRHFGI